MKGNKIFTIVLLLIVFFMANLSNAAEADKLPDEVFHKFIKSQNSKISKSRTKLIVDVVKYYNPRYFGNEGLYNEGMINVLSIMALESNFENVNGDEGVSIGYMQIQNESCDIARKYNGIHRKLNLISLRENIWCGMAEINRLHEKLDGDWGDVIRAYNGGLGVILYPEVYRKGNRQTKRYLSLVNNRKIRLQRGIIEYYITKQGVDKSTE